MNSAAAPTDEQTTADVIELARQRQIRGWAWSVGLFALLLPLGFLAGFLVIGDGAPDREFLGVFLLVAAVALLSMGLVLAFLIWRRRQGARWAQPPLLLGVDLDRRRSIIKSVRAGEPVEGRDHEVAADLAHRLSGQGKALYSLPVLVLGWILILAMVGFNILSGFLLVGIGLIAMALLFNLRDVRRGRIWLEKYTSERSPITPSSMP